MPSILVVGEKSSQVKTFASALCGKYTSNKLSKYVYEYAGTWTNSKNTNYQVTFLPLAGHISSIDTAKGYGWGECPPIKIVHDPRALEVKYQNNYVKHLVRLIKTVDELWLGLDPDSEGDNIALEVVNILKSFINKNSIPIRRIWNSSLTKKEIIRSFENPIGWSDKLALGVQGRRTIDAWLGFAGTREVTRAARQASKVKVVSVGRVQLPTLFFVVRRDLLHETFVPLDRWKLMAELSEKGQQDKKDWFLADHEKQFFLDQKVMNTLARGLRKLKGTNQAEVKDVKRKTNNNPPPFPLNTTAAVSLLSKLMKVSAAQGLDLMAKLYNKGYLSYPRTENKRFKDSFPHKKIISDLLGYTSFIPIIKSIKNSNQVRRNGKKMGVEDHDPIHPTGMIKGVQNLPPKELKAWQILSRYYLSLFMDDQLIDNVKATIEIDNQIFVAEGKKTSQKGWLEAQNWIKPKESELPALSAGQSLWIMNIKTKKQPTKPPPRLTDSQILLMMEKMGVGTKSSRPDILKKLIDRNYCYRKGRQIISTDWGRGLIASLVPIWPDVVTPTFTSMVENLMDEVAKDKKPYPDMLDFLRRHYMQLHKQLIMKLGDYKGLLRKLNLKPTEKTSTEGNTQLLLELLQDQLAGDEQQGEDEEE